MDIGIGLPNTLPATGAAMVDWARRAEERGFASLATIDRIVYPTYDSLTSLAVAAGATSRIGLFPNILLAPLYPVVWLAKATASLHAMSGGRLTLGLGLGGRPDDFQAMHRPFTKRGRLMDEGLDVLTRAWAGEEVTGAGSPATPVLRDDLPAGLGVVVPEASAGTKPSVLIGGQSEQAVRRTVEYGDGWTVGGATPEMAAPMIEKVRRAWQDAGREGEPRIAALVYFGLGDPDESRASLRKYYGFLGEWVDMIVEGAARTPQAVKDVARGFADVGVTDLVFDPTIADVAEVDRLADAVL
jgi:alkanesulfonate monooxygenase SsuD/methylene tetrahydromethanopterin reductase-like flavin-dependent oxidoreductase (luciferase family)